MPKILDRLTKQLKNKGYSLKNDWNKREVRPSNRAQKPYQNVIQILQFLT